MTSDHLRYELASATLDNGLSVVVSPDPGAPGVAVNLWVEVGSADEVTGRTGFAHLFEHLMFQGSSQVASGEHMATIESVGGTVNATTSNDRTNYFETVPRGALDLALWLEADRFASLAITPENFEAQRQVVKEEKRQRYDNQPYGDLLQLLTAQHFTPDHPYGHLTIGSMTDLDDASLDDVAGFFDAWYRASNVRVVLCGPITPDEGLALAERHLGSLPRLEKLNRISMPDGGLLTPQTTVVRRSVPHSLAYLSWVLPPAAHPDHPALALALSVLADGTSSRLHRALVRRGDLAHEVHGATLTNRSSSSIVTILGRPAETAGADRLAEAILSEIDNFLAAGPSDDELARAAAQYERDWLWELATVGGRADAINEAWLTFGSPDHVNTHLSEILALTPDDIRSVAARWLAPDATHQLHYLAEDAR
ncbi:MAG: insulinase family protein [Tessaracoccus sp.]|uniref:M16 family metallopeptidase n=1 Tax=Tessaracoccus sp. TaxID=1971211 RepID=UPI001EB3A409|nr:pitrilysin family protein [Tessaracoccus sp.]MBK7821346.1 insulinase family protein [Tessaracoccus sp.]